MEAMMHKAKKLLLVIVGGAAAVMMTTAANAYYCGPYGCYPTCVPGYWAPGPLGPIWVPAV